VYSGVKKDSFNIIINMEYLPSNSDQNRTKFQLQYQVFAAASLKMTTFWDTAPRKLVEEKRHFRGAYCLHYQGDEPEDGCSKHL
jgi:hypothetical protein